jgi:3-hydroxybutyryl-CoA dehydrogenase
LDILFIFTKKLTDNLIYDCNAIFITDVNNIITDNQKNVIRFTGWQTLFNTKKLEISIGKNCTVDYVTVLDALQIEYIVVPNIIGHIVPRVIAMLVNEAYFALEERVSTKAEIDIAMLLGTNYPYGPFAWSEKIGLQHIYDLLQQLSITDDRYRISTRLINDLK